MSETTEKGRAAGVGTLPESGTPPESRKVFAETVSGTSVITPPIDPYLAYRLEHWSADLAAPRKVIVDSVHGFEFQVVPEIDVSGAMNERGSKRVREILEGARLVDLLDEVSPGEDPFENLDVIVTDEQVENQVVSLGMRQKAETVIVQRFFDRVYPEGPLTQLRNLLGNDRFLTGGYWLAVARDRNVRPARFTRLQPEQMRFTVQGRRQVLYRRMVRVGVQSLQVQLYPRYPRLIVQIRDGSRPVRYYREWGDTRFVDAHTGTVFPSRQAFNVARQRSRGRDSRKVELATEVLFVGNHHPATMPYGRPDWWPSRLDIEASTKAKQVVSQHFADPSPRVIVMVAGGTIPTNTASAFSKAVEEQSSGVRNFGKMVVVDGIKSDPDQIRQDPNYGGGIPKIEALNLGSGMPKDMFVGLTTANELTIGAATGTPPLLRSRDKDVNRASAKEQERVFESRNAQPERKAAWDDPMNVFILPEIGICTVKVRSGGPTLSTEAEKNEQLRLMNESGILNPNDARPHVRIADISFAAREPSPETPWTETPKPFAKLLSDGVVVVPGTRPNNSDDEEDDETKTDQND